jgi:hypothetical protein
MNLMGAISALETHRKTNGPDGYNIALGIILAAEIIGDKAENLNAALKPLFDQYAKSIELGLRIAQEQLEDEQQ